MMAGFRDGKTYMFQSLFNQQAIDLFCSGYQQNKVWAHPFNQGVSQQWTVAADSKDASFFVLMSVCNQSSCFRVLDQDSANSRLCYNEFIGEKSQFWTTVEVSPEIFIIKNCENNTAVTVQGPQDELNLQELCPTNPRQHWKIIEVTRSSGSSG